MNCIWQFASQTSSIVVTGWSSWSSQARVAAHIFTVQATWAIVGPRLSLTGDSRAGNSRRPTIYLRSFLMQPASFASKPWLFHRRAVAAGWSTWFFDWSADLSFPMGLMIIGDAGLPTGWKTWDQVAIVIKPLLSFKMAFLLFVGCSLQSVHSGCSRTMIPTHNPSLHLYVSISLPILRQI